MIEQLEIVELGCEFADLPQELVDTGILLARRVNDSFVALDPEKRET
jgi:hypothetical protein|tara:strand:+ start:983 stop:1123 length:141 start_codon:yes stop_codon:yes gene_type:complete